MPVEPLYLVRYGLMGHVGRFPLDRATKLEATITRGQAVVLLTDRGVELGEVLVAADGSYAPHDVEPNGDLDLDRPRVLRPAVPADLEEARLSESLRSERFSLCQRILGDGGWPLDLIDVEPLLDPSTTVLHILGPLDLDLAALRSEFRSRSEFDVLFEPAGTRAGISQGSSRMQEPSPSVPEPIRRCGDCDCSDGGCGATASDREVPRGPIATAKEAPVSSCGTSASHSGCASCGVSQWMAGKRREGRE